MDFINKMSKMHCFKNLYINDIACNILRECEKDATIKKQATESSVHIHVSLAPSQRNDSYAYYRENDKSP